MDEAPPLELPPLRKPDNVALAGLGYRAGSGKNQTALFMAEEAAVPVIEFSFAKTLKDAAGAIFRLTHEELYGARKETLNAFWGLTPRQILQRMGTDCMRRCFASNIWVASMQMSLQERIDALGGEPALLVVTDVRFPDEATAIRRWGGIVLHVVRPLAGADAGALHASETAMDGFAWDGIVDNSGTLDDLRRATRDALALCGVPERPTGSAILVHGPGHD